MNAWSIRQRSLLDEQILSTRRVEALHGQRGLVEGFSAVKLTVYDELTDVQDVWLELESRGYGYCFQRYAWAEAWQGSVGAALGAQPRILVFSAESGDRPAVLFPLVVRRVGGVNALIPLGGGHADYAGVLVSKNTASAPTSVYWREIVSWAEGNGVDLVYLDRMPMKIGDAPNPMADSEMVSCHPTGQLILSGNWDQYYAERMKPRVRADIRRQRKRLAEIGTLSFEVATSMTSAQPLLRAMIEQKRRRYAEMGVNDQFGQQAFVNFYEQLTETGLRSGMIHLSGLKVGETIVATHWGAVDCSRFYYLMPTYDGGAWAKYSPGKVLLESLIKWAYEAGLRTFDFTVGAENYKTEWCDAAMPLYRMRKAMTWKGTVLLKAMILREQIKASAAYAKFMRSWQEKKRLC